MRVFCIFIYLLTSVTVLSAEDLLPPLTADQQSAIFDLQPLLIQAHVALEDASRQNLAMLRHAERLTQLESSLADGSTGLPDVSSELKSVERDLSPVTLTDIVKRLDSTSIENKRAVLYGKRGDPMPAEVSSILAEADRTKDSMSSAKSDMLAGEVKLRSSILAIPKAAASLGKEMDTDLGHLNEDVVDLKSATPTPTATAKMIALSKSIETLPRDQEVRASLQRTWNPLKDLISNNVCRLYQAVGNQGTPPPSELSKPSDGCEPKADAVSKNLDDCTDPNAVIAPTTTAMCSILLKIPVWLSNSSDVIIALANDAQKQVVATLQNAVGQGSTTENKLSESTAPREAARKILAAWSNLTPVLLRDSVPARDATQKKASDLDTQLANLDVSLNLLADSIEGSAQEFESDSVRLYYFSDVRRMMEFLNPMVEEIGSLTQAKAESQRQKNTLVDLESDLDSKMSEVNRYKYESTVLEEQQRQAQSQLDAVQLISKGLSNRNLSVQKRKLLAQTRYDRAKAASDAGPNDALKTAALRKAESDRNDSNSLSDTVQKEYSDSKSSSDAAASKLEATKEDKRGLPQRIEDSRAALIGAGEAVAQQRAKIRSAAINEAEAFAEARDNAPYLRSRAVASHTDPLKRVNMYAFQDQRIIYLRGKPLDITRVKQAIAKFDQPAPQARLTLWEMELNVEPSSLKGSFSSNKKASDQLNESAQLVDRQLLKTRSRMAYATSSYQAAVVKEVEVSHCSDNQFSEFPERQFFDKGVLKTLDMGKDTDKKILQLMPDPKVTTTLGEAILLSLLTCKESRLKIMNNFNKTAREAYKRYPAGNGSTAKLCNPHSPSPECFAQTNLEANRCWPQRLAQRLGYECSVTSVISDASFESAANGQQREIALALLSQIRTRAVRAFEQNITKASELVESCKKKEKKSGEDQCNVSAVGTVTFVIKTVPKWLKTNGPLDLPELPETLDGASEALVSLTDELRKLEANALREATPREAAADELLKEIIIAFEDDLDEAFVEPMLDSLREGFKGYKHIRVGTVNRTSILATNRLQARVDARSSAALSIGEETDILQSVEQLASIYLTAQSGGALAAVGSLKSLPHEKQSEIYGITNNGTFQVRPVFDPSGQALRFSFDHVTANAIREPNGTINAQFPHVERHTVNTEVQISNLELREISRFSSNSQLGLPTRYSGGIPIIKDIPFVRPYVPLLGWFVRQSGRAATTTQSFIFGQSITYPTIGDIIDLLSPEL